MHRFIIFFLCALFTLSLYAQKVQNTDFDNRLKSLLSHSVKEIDVNEIADSFENYFLLDAREYEEYKISHIPGALYFGYDKKRWEILDTIDPSQAIIVYCSVGYRSEKVAELLQKRGFTHVGNLYGSIFEWANCNLPLENINGGITDSIHTYNKNWSRWVNNPHMAKVW